MHRRSVDLPTAGRADQADDLVLGDVEVDAPGGPRADRRTCAGPSIRRALASTVVIAADRRSAALLAPDEPVDEPGHRDRQQEEDHRGDDVGRVVERRGLPDLGGPEDLDDAKDADQRGVLLEADEVVEQRRDDAPDGLRQDDEAHAPGAG